MLQKKIKLFILLIGVSFCLLTNCDFGEKRDIPFPICSGVTYPAKNFDKITINQGVGGDIWLWEGNFMPLCPSGTITPVSREIYIYELTSLNQVKQEDPLSFYSEIYTELITTVQSGNNGFFQIELEPGTYSIFVKENDLYYANLYDGYGNIYPIEIKANEVTKIRFDINYKSYW